MFHILLDTACNMLHGDLIQGLPYLCVSLTHLIASVSANIYFPHVFCVAKMMYCIVSGRICHTNWQLSWVASPASQHEAKGDNMKSCCIDNSLLSLRWRDKKGLSRGPQNHSCFVVQTAVLSWSFKHLQKGFFFCFIQDLVVQAKQLKLSM